MVTDVYNSNAKLSDTIRVGWQNGSCDTVFKPAGTVTVSGEVTYNKSLQVTVGQGTEQALNVEMAMESKNKTGGKISYSPSWTSGQTRLFTEATTVGVGITDQNLGETVGVGHAIAWRLDIYGRKGNSSHEIRKQHWCYGQRNGAYCYNYYLDHDQLVGAGMASGERPYSVVLVYLGVI